MFIPESFLVTDPKVIFPFIEAFAFATIVTAPPEGPLQVTHAPLFLDRTIDPAVLTGHFARENSHWRYLDAGRESLAIFHGPHAYVSPTWYRQAPAVPTWNYAVVHVHGVPHVVEDGEERREILEMLVGKYEADRSRQWRSADVPTDYFCRMIDRVVVFSMPVGRIEAKFKLGQNRTAEDRQGVLEGLLSEGSDAAHALAEFSRRHGGDEVSR